MAGAQPAARIQSLDHLVITVKDVQATIRWYEQNLGLTSSSFTSVADPDVTRYSLKFGTQKINIHQLGKEFEPKALNVKGGSADLCFITEDDVYGVRQRLEHNGVKMVDLKDEKTDRGTVIRTGARGKLRSVYCRDPDGNLIEISNYVQ